MSRKTKKKRAGSETGGKKKQKPPDSDRILTLADNLLFATVLLILFMRPFMSGRTYPHYNHFFHIAVCVAAILWMVKCYRRGTLELHDRLLTGFVLAFALVCSFTLFTTVNKGLTLRYIYEILSYALLFLVIANNFRNAGSIKAAVMTILLAALLVNAYGIYQRYYTLEMTRRHVEAVMASGSQDMLMGVPLESGLLYRMKSTRVFSTFLFPNAYALFLNFVGALTAGWILSMRSEIARFARGLIKRPIFKGREVPGYILPEPTKTPANSLLRLVVRHGFRRAILRFLFRLGCFLWIPMSWLVLPLIAAYCLLIAWNLWLTLSRGGLLTAVAILLAFIALGILRKKRIPTKELAAIVIAVCILTTLFAPAGAAFSAEQDDTYEESFVSRLKDVFSIQQRFTYWEAAIEMVKDNPWFGVGWGAYEKAYPRYMVLGGYPVKLAHNNYLQVWAETGTVGLNAFVGIWLVFLHTYWRKTSPAVGKLWGIACGLGAAVIGFLAHSLVEFALYVPPLMYYVFAMMGLLVAVPIEGGEGDKFTFRFTFPRAAVAAALLSVLVLFILRSFMGLWIFMKVEDERNNVFPTNFARQRGISVDPARQLVVLRESVPRLQESLRYYPLAADTHHILGDTYMKLSIMEKAPHRLDDAIKHFRRACELDPLSPHIYQSLALVYWKAGNARKDRSMYQRALEAEIKASENFPVNPEYHDKLREIYRALGMKDKAKEERRKVRDLRKHYKRY